MAKNIPNFYPDFTSERWTLMELRRLNNVLLGQSEFKCRCPHPRDLTNVIGLGHRSRGYIVKGFVNFKLIRRLRKHFVVRISRFHYGSTT